MNLVYLCHYYKLHEVAEYWHQVVKINNFQKNRIAMKIINHFGGNLDQIKIAILGWSFKPNTNDSRESPSIYITEKLFKAGASLSIYDPKINQAKIFEDINNLWGVDQLEIEEQNRIKILSNPFNDLSNFDAIAILTEWDIFKNYNWGSLPKNVLLIDGVN